MQLLEDQLDRRKHVKYFLAGKKVIISLVYNKAVVSFNYTLVITCLNLESSFIQSVQ